MPRIEGTAWFVDQITAGLEYLREEMAAWFLYVTQRVRVIGPIPVGASV